jgi:hypothetical protein
LTRNGEVLDSFYVSGTLPISRLHDVGRIAHAIIMGSQELVMTVKSAGINRSER